MKDVFFYEDGVGLATVHNAGGKLEPEVWVAEHGAEMYPDAIYFFAELTVN